MQQGIRRLLTIGSLFSGIGGFELGLERTGGFTTEWQCEIDPYCLRVLEKHWPLVKRFTDIKQLTNPPYVDVMCGGFPCQDISLAGKGAGLKGERSGLWKEFARIIAEGRPKYVKIENVAALRSRGLDQVLSDLNEIGYDAEWHCIPASYVGAPHRRDRLWILAYARKQCEHYLLSKRGGEGSKSFAPAGTLDVDNAFGCANGIGTIAVPNSSSTGLQGYTWYGENEWRSQQDGSVGAADLLDREHPEAWWLSEPNVGRVVDGIQNRVDRIKSLGNAIVPQVATMIGHWILAREANG